MNRCHRVLAFLEHRPNHWISALEFEPFGRLSWRTRVSEARQVIEARGGKLENQVRRGPKGVVLFSLYRYTPPPSDVQRDLFERVELVALTDERT